MNPIRQGDVILTTVESGNLAQRQPAPLDRAQRLNHLTLAEGEVTGHRHRIADGDAELYERNSTLYLYVRSESARLVHEEHKPIDVPMGIWQVRIQREYVGTEQPQVVFRPVED
ncbi:hypothetical protein [Thermoleptolyngbya sp. C42_A2020_037]|uniref:hypothetical protein n=1 Tax=Thermoleptolyngbya sp. C42_A2020_037 TaxID=2747799 RepID=UPI0019DCC378|nr:hypothetical protein [Thermoleptolyngbya sp. C42_A2020_037]MBF2083484.1 hypothetical protein [Thermoleptolyngbya sp. C42_A2020_037]